MTDESAVENVVEYVENGDVQGVKRIPHVHADWLNKPEKAQRGKDAIQSEVSRRLSMELAQGEKRERAIQILRIGPMSHFHLTMESPRKMKKTHLQIKKDSPLLLEEDQQGPVGLHHRTKVCWGVNLQWIQTVCS